MPGGQSALPAELETCAYQYPDRASPSGDKDTSLSHQLAKPRFMGSRKRDRKQNIKPHKGLSDSSECQYDCVPFGDAIRRSEEPPIVTAFYDFTDQLHLQLFQA